MKLEIYHEEKETVVEEPVRLKLVNDGGGVLIKTVDKNGRSLICGNLILINIDGTFHRMESVSSSLGFQLNENGQIVEAI